MIPFKYTWKHENTDQYKTLLQSHDNTLRLGQLTDALIASPTVDTVNMAVSELNGIFDLYVPLFQEILYPRKVSPQRTYKINFMMIIMKTLNSFH